MREKEREKDSSLSLSLSHSLHGSCKFSCKIYLFFSWCCVFYLVLCQYFCWSNVSHSQGPVFEYIYALPCCGKSREYERYKKLQKSQVSQTTEDKDCG